MTDETLSLDLFGNAEEDAAAPEDGAEERVRRGKGQRATSQGRQGAPESVAPPPGPPRPSPTAGPEEGRGGSEAHADSAEQPTDESARDEPEVWTVSQVNRAVRNLLERTLPPVWVSGEVGGWKRARSGHCYFTLKDDQAQIRCVMWRTEAARLPTDPDEGMEVRVQGNLTLYEARGEYQLVVRRLEAAGEEGLWRIAFEKLRRKLDAEGLLAPERKRPIPRFPACVGVVTSPTGAAFHDITSVIRRRAPWTRVLLRGARVQGAGAALEVAEAVRVLGRSGLVEVIIVGRGGGSIEDLWCFNEEPVARAIAACPVPVISAVGHEVDVTISDLVADLRAPTPSAAAEAAVQDGGTLLEALRRLPPRLSRGLRSCVDRRRSSVRDGRHRLVRGMERALQPRRDRTRRGAERLERAMERVLQPRRERAGRGAERLERGMRRALDARGQRLREGVAKLEALSPLSTLRRGYAVPLGEGGRVLRGVRDFERGVPFTLRVADGRVECEPLETWEQPEEAMGEGNG